MYKKEFFQLLNTAQIFQQALPKMRSKTAEKADDLHLPSVKVFFMGCVKSVGCLSGMQY